MEVELTTDGVRIRTFRAEDIPHLYEAVRESLPELMPWTLWAHPDYSLDDSKGWVMARATVWEAGTEYTFAIFDEQGERFMGVVGLNLVESAHRKANLGYWVRSSSTGRGVATTATRLAARYGIEQLNFQRLEIVASTKNLASQRVAEKAGAQREGVLRKGLNYHGTPHDAAVYSLVAEDLGRENLRES
jgi:ribosomal-protein-serine acetyltransferase